MNDLALLACIARNPWLVFDAIGPRRLDGAPHATPEPPAWR
jgi:hypothetical protein